MDIEQRKTVLYLAYIDELNKYQASREVLSADERMRRVRSVKDNIYTEWIEIWDKGEMVGFLLIGHPPNVVEGFDYYIQESYIVPIARKRGLMQQHLEIQFRDYPGRYCMYILDKNYKAKQFWNKIIPRFNGAWIPEIDDPMPEAGCSIYGFEV